MTRILLAFLALACCVQLTHAQAQKYPSRPVRLIVPVPPGSGTSSPRVHLRPAPKPRLGGRRDRARPDRPGTGHLVLSGR